MKISCGTDIIEIRRIEDAILNKNIKNRVFTEKEIKYCETKKNTKFEHYAARFAAKEAIFKAISNNLKDKYDIEWKDIEITNDEQGRPSASLNKKLNIENIDVSLSHCKEYAVANCVILWR